MTSTAIPVLFKRTDPSVRIPERSTDGSAGWDIYAHRMILNPEDQSAIVYTGLYTAFPNTLMMCLVARSGLGSNFGLVPANGTGVIDSDYRGEIMIKFRDLTIGAYFRLDSMREKALMGEPERIVQALFLPVLPVVLVETNELPESVRGTGGFGSTDRVIAVNKDDIHGRSMEEVLRDGPFTEIQKPKILENVP